MRLLIVVIIAVAVFGLAWYFLMPAEATPKYKIHVGKPVPAQAPRDYMNNKWPQ